MSVGHPSDSPEALSPNPRRSTRMIRNSSASARCWGKESRLQPKLLDKDRGRAIAEDVSVKIGHRHILRDRIAYPLRRGPAAGLEARGGD
jgi:hypothetical protein